MIIGPTCGYGVFLDALVQEFKNANLLVNGELVDPVIIENFLNSNGRSYISFVETKIYVTESGNVLILQRNEGRGWDSSSIYYTVLIEDHAKKFLDNITKELENKNRNLEILQKKLMTKSTPPLEIKLPSKTANDNV